MEEKAVSQPLPHGYFPVRITLATGLASRFISEARQQHPIAVIQPPYPADDCCETAVIATTFRNKELLRVAFNIFAADMETEHGIKMKCLMESATEFM